MPRSTPYTSSVATNLTLGPMLLRGSYGYTLFSNSNYNQVRELELQITLVESLPSMFEAILRYIAHCFKRREKNRAPQLVSDRELAKAPEDMRRLQCGWLISRPECLTPYQAALEAKTGSSKWARIITDSSDKDKDPG